MFIQASTDRLVRINVIRVFAGVKLCAELRPELYKLMVESLSPEEDLGVRLAASLALKLAMDDFLFNSGDFTPFLEPAFSLLFALLKEVNECDTKVRYISFVRLV